MSKQPKELPFAPRKGQIYTMYHHIPEKTARKRLNEMIADFCTKTKQTFNPKLSSVDRPVWIEWVKTYGLPKGYEDNQDIFNQPSIS